MTTTYTLLEDLATEIELAVGDADITCVVDRVTVTAGEYAPLSNCNAVYLWASTLADENEFDPVACNVRGRITLNYRVSVCYTEEADDQTDVEHAVPAQCLYGLIDAIWCHLVRLRDSKDLLGCDCTDAKVGPIAVGPRQGGVVTADGTVTVPYDCPLITS